MIIINYGHNYFSIILRINVSAGSIQHLDHREVAAVGRQPQGRISFFIFHLNRRSSVR